MTGPVAFALAEAIDKQLANAMGANGSDGDRASHCVIFAMTERDRKEPQQKSLFL